MDDYRLIFPMFAMFLLTLSTLMRLFRVRSKFVSEGKIDVDFFKTYQQGSEPEKAAQLARHFANLYEAPVLFYVCCLAALATGITGTIFFLLACLYVCARVVHTYIHTGSNEIWPRVYAYFSSWLVLLCMWVVLVYRVAYPA